MKLNIIDVEKERYSGIDNYGTKLNEIRIQFYVEQDDNEQVLYKLFATNREAGLSVFSLNQGWVRLKKFKTFCTYDNNPELFIKEANKYMKELFQYSNFKKLFETAIMKFMSKK